MVRRLAVDALQKMEAGRGLAQDAVGALIGSKVLSPPDRAFLWELVHGVTRHRVTLDRIITTFSRVRMRKVHPRVLQALRIAVYQIVYLDRVPVPSAVFESVEIVKTDFPAWVVKFLNGCLRAIARAVDIKVGGTLRPEDACRAVPISGMRFCIFTEPLFPDPREEPARSLAERHSHPVWLVERWLERYGEETTESLLRAGNEPPSLWLRPSPGRLRDLTREFGKRGILHQVEEDPPEAIRLLEHLGRIDELPGYVRGWFVIQDRTAMQAVRLLAPRPGERVLDLCAAPGGKASQLAQMVGPEGTVVAVDRDARRLVRLDETLGRLGLRNVATVVADVQAKDLDLGPPYDRVMVDVPCSNTGVLAKRVEVRHRVTPETVDSLLPVQRGILFAATRFVRPGGVLVYSTCTLTPEENGGVVDTVLERGAPFELESEEEILPVAGYADGGYLARLRREP